MPPPRLELQNLNLADYDNIVAGLGDLTNERNLPQQFMNGLMTNAKKLLEFFKKPQQAIDGLMENARKLLDFLKKPRKFGTEVLDTEPTSRAYRCSRRAPFSRYQLHGHLLVLRRLWLQPRWHRRRCVHSP